MSGYGWDLDKDDPMVVVITYNGVKIMSFFLGEAIESAGYKNVMKHVRECNRSPWLKKWHEEAMDANIEVLKGNKNG